MSPDSAGFTSVCWSASMAITSAASVTLSARCFAVRPTRPASSMRTTWRSRARDAFRQRATRILAQTAAYDHCNFTVLDGAPPEPVARFRELLLEMSYGDAEVRPLLDLEGLKAVGARPRRAATRSSPRPSIDSARSTRS